jgi:hypothetical protein
MKKKLLLVFSLFLSLSFFGQTTETYNIVWTFGSNTTVAPTAPNYTNKTIEVGDAVNWNFSGSGSHTVTSQSGSPESFNSGLIASGAGVTYSRIFNVLGEYNYVCTPHSGNMYGKITVVAEGTLANESFSGNNNKITLFPNPANQILNINQSLSDNNLELAFFDVLGKQVLNIKIFDFENVIDVSQLEKGVYLLLFTSDTNAIEIRKFVKN